MVRQHVLFSRRGFTSKNYILYLICSSIFNHLIKGVLYFRPFWLSPRQGIVVPVAPPFDDYAKKVICRTCMEAKKKNPEYELTNVCKYYVLQYPADKQYRNVIEGVVCP